VNALGRHIVKHEDHHHRTNYDTTEDAIGSQLGLGLGVSQTFYTPLGASQSLSQFPSLSSQRGGLLSQRQRRRHQRQVGGEMARVILFCKVRRKYML
jgi:hypothetical protein